jgi:hypothetical protein
MISGKTIIAPLLCFWLLSACNVQESIKNKSDDLSRQITNVVETVAPQPTKINSDGLPNKHLISTAFVPQAPEKIWDQPWQDACEEAALLTVDYYYRDLKPDTATMLSDYQKMFDFEASENWTHDVTLTQMATISAEFLGYQTKIIDSPTIESIKTFIAADTPVIIPANGKILYTENKHFKSGGPWYHNLVILGYDDAKSQFTVHDVGTQFGAYFRYSYATLMDSIHDFPESLKKEEINTGQKRVLILLK